MPARSRQFRLPKWPSAMPLANWHSSSSKCFWFCSDLHPARSRSSLGSGMFLFQGYIVAQALHQSTIKSLPLLARGKVRDMYAVGDDKLLIVASERISAFDVILDDPIPGKGQVLTELT